MVWPGSLTIFDLQLQNFALRTAESKSIVRPVVGIKNSRSQGKISLGTELSAGPEIYVQLKESHPRRGSELVSPPHLSIL